MCVCCMCVCVCVGVLCVCVYVCCVYICVWVLCVYVRARAVSSHFIFHSVTSVPLLRKVREDILCLLSAKSCRAFPAIM